MRISSTALSAVVGFTAVVALAFAESVWLDAADPFAALASAALLAGGMPLSFFAVKNVLFF